MFQQGQQPGAGSRESVFQKCLSALGTAISFAVMILATPRVYAWSRMPLHEYLSGAYDAKWGNVLTWTFGAIEAAIIFFGVRLIFTSVLIWAFAALAARRFPAG